MEADSMPDVRRILPRPVAPWALLALAACADPRLPPELLAARDRLESALDARDPDAVARAAREAAAWKGRDPELDRALGDALANVLLRPKEGLVLLRANPAPDDPAWRLATAEAVLREGDPEAIAAAAREMALGTVPADHPVVAQVAWVAAHDPAVRWGDLAQAVETCELLDRAARKGLVDLDAPVGGPLVAAARALGAERVVAGRPLDPDPDLRLHRPWACRFAIPVEGEPTEAGRWRAVHVVAARDGLRVTLWLRPEGDGWRAFGASDLEVADRWLAAAELLAGGAGPAAVKARFPGGLFGFGSAP